MFLPNSQRVARRRHTLPPEHEDDQLPEGIGDPPQGRT